MEPNKDPVYRRLAQLYTEEDGRRLLEELAALEAEDVLRATPGLDRRVLGEVRRRKRRRWGGTIGLVAAAFLLLVLAPQLRQMRPWVKGGAATEEPQLFMYKEYEEAAEEELYDEDAPENPVTAGAPTPDGFDAGGGTIDPETGGGAIPESEMRSDGDDLAIIPLSFELPGNFSVAAVELDNGKTIYQLDDALRDDVVLTMEYTPEPPAAEGLLALELNGETVYATSTDDYNLLTFQKEGIQYLLTCRYDLNTLMTLGRNIL